MLPRYSIRMWFTFTMIFYKCWTSVTDTGILSLNLKIDNSCLKTVNRNLKSTTTIKNYNFSYFQRISASIWNLIVLLHTAPRKGLLCTYRASIRYSDINSPPRQASSVSEFISSPPCYANPVHHSLVTKELTLAIEEDKNMLYQKSANTCSVSFPANLYFFRCGKTHTHLAKTLFFTLLLPSASEKHHWNSAECIKSHPSEYWLLPWPFLIREEMFLNQKDIKSNGIACRSCSKCLSNKGRLHTAKNPLCVLSKQSW